MKYWWVSQNQTFKHEFNGGFMWSPKITSNRRKNPFYDFMTEVQPGDIVFSYNNTYIAAIGIATSRAYSSDKPLFGKAGSNWRTDGWRVEVDYVEPRRRIKPKNHMHLIAPLLPEKYSPLQPNGNGNIVYLASISNELGSLLLELADAPPLVLEVPDLSKLEFDEEEQVVLADVTLSEVQKETLIMARRGQGRFRDRVSKIEKFCRVTGVDSSQLLIASHIKPWSKSEPAEKIDGNNGLFLSPHVDKLFNDGFITFTSQGKLEVADSFDSKVLEAWGIDPTRNFGSFNSDQAFFLEYHNKEKFGSIAFVS